MNEEQDLQLMRREADALSVLVLVDVAFGVGVDGEDVTEMEMEFAKEAAKTDMRRFAATWFERDLMEARRYIQYRSAELDAIGHAR